MVRNAGSAISRSSQSMPLICCIIRKPTRTSAGTAASLGTIATSGAKNVASRNSTPVTTLARPVRAPSATPEARLDVGRVAGDAGGTTGGRGERVDDQDPLGVRGVAVLVEEVGLRADGGHRAEGVEEVGEQQREDEQRGRDDAGVLPGAEQAELAEQREVGLGARSCRATRAREAPAGRVVAGWPSSTGASSSPKTGTVNGPAPADVRDLLDDDRRARWSPRSRSGSRP